MSVKLSSAQQVCRFDTKRFSYARQHDHAGVPFAAFDPANVGQVKFSAERQLFLCKPARLATLAHISSNDGAPILHPTMDGDRAYIL